MTTCVDRRRLAAVAILALITGGLVVGDAVVGAQAGAMLQRPRINWMGPFAITPNDTARFNYWNGGIDRVLIHWAFSNAITGEVVCGNFGQPAVPIEPGKGAIWDFSTTLDPDTGKEVPHCDGASDVEPGGDERYFDRTMRHQLVAWILIRHTTQAGLQRAVDLPTVEIYNSMMMMPSSDGTPMRSMTFGRTLEVIHANPTAPTDAMLQKVMTTTER